VIYIVYIVSFLWNTNVYIFYIVYMSMLRLCKFWNANVYSLDDVKQC